MLVKKIRIFVASPGDVQAERDALNRVVAELQRTVGTHHELALELVRWETHAYPAAGRVQGIVNEQIGTYDIFVGLLWKRFGTPTGEADSGTEEEFNRAYASWQAQGTPHILFYFCERSFTPVLEEMEQLAKVLAFKKQFPEKGLYGTYDTVEAFERLVRDHLTQVLHKLRPNVSNQLPPATPQDAAQDEARRTYVTALRKQCHVLPLAAMGGEPGAREEVSLNEVYVALNTTSVPEKDQTAREKRHVRPFEEKAEPVTALEALAASQRMVLRGAPGSGKTTFVRQVIADLVTAEFEETAPPAGLPRGLTPLLVVLRDLMPALEALNLKGLRTVKRQARLLDTFLDQVIAALTDVYRAPGFAQGLTEALEAGTCVLVLDGLDEVPVAQRALLRDLVAAVHQRWAPYQIVVTCRVRSYNDDLPTFTPYTLAPFDDDQKQTFAHSWYQAQHRLGRITPQEAATAKGNDLAKAATGDDLSDLAKNPMLLTTMAIIHQRNVGLPKERVRLYDVAVDVLLRHWQEHRAGELTQDPRLEAFLNDNRRLRKTVERLAYEAHRVKHEARTAADMSRGDALHLLESPDYVGDPQTASAFLAYVDQRAGILVGQGGHAERPESYSFPHRTFQEYLAGCYVFGQRNLKRALRSLAAEGDYWNVAVQLGSEDLWYNRGRDHEVLDLIYQLCPALCPTKPPAQRLIVWAAQMVVFVGVQPLEQDTDEDGFAFVRRLREHLVAVLAGALPPVERALAGRVLARLGDPRKGVTTLEHMAWCPVPAGSFRMGSPDTDELAYEDEKPLQEMDVPYAYWISRFPITVAQYDQFVQAGGYTNKLYWTPDGWQWKEKRGGTGPSVYGETWALANHPVTGVSWHELRQDRDQCPQCCGRVC